MSDTYIYPLVVEKGEDGGLGLYFPDFPGTAVLADDITTAIKQAKELLIARIIELEEQGLPLPAPSEAHDIEDLEPTDRVVFVDVYMPPYRDEAAQRSVTKNCTLPKWLRDAGDRAGLNYSLILQKGLKEALGINDQPRS